jgi:ABC-type multidrug transport system ATPase subunit
MYSKYNYIIETEKLTRCFGDVLAVELVDLQVPLGSVYGFLGPNGAGKTTTIRMLLGLIKPNRGKISLFGRPYTRRDWQALARVGALVETPSLYPNLTGRENLEVCRRLIQAPYENIAEVLESVKLTRDANRLVKGYSQGMRQRLGIALAMLSKPALLILDEPTNGLDPAGIQEMRETIRELPNRQGVTVFLSSHLLGEVEQVASHIGIIHKGRLIFQGSLKELQAQRNPILHLSSDQPDRAQQILLDAGWRVRRNGKPGLLVEVNGDSDAALINKQLMTQNIKVFQLNIDQPDLEDIFLQFTQPKD